MSEIPLSPPDDGRATAGEPEIRETERAGGEGGDAPLRLI